MRRHRRHVRAVNDTIAVDIPRAVAGVLARPLVLVYRLEVQRTDDDIAVDIPRAARAGARAAALRSTLDLRPMASGHVISDLHLFAHRSVADSYMRDIRRAAAESDFFVLNGDIFDFRWSTLPTADDSLDAAVAWLRALVTEHPHCRFFYTVGNHDC